MGCAHTQAAPSSRAEELGEAVKLQCAIRAGQAQFAPVCDSCLSGGTPICCLQCDFVACPKHASAHEHDLGVVFSNNTEVGVVWCFKCADIVLSPSLQRAAHTALTEARRTLDGHSESKIMLSKPPICGGVRVPPFHAFEGLRGLVNMGATCYASVVLQSLVHNPLVRTYFLAGGHQRALCRRSGCLACGVDQLFSDFFGSAAVGGYGISDLLVRMAEREPEMGAGSTEQDAHEFYLMLLNEFHNASHAATPQLEQALGPKSDDASGCGCVAHRSFGGSIESTLSCNCGYTAKRREPIVDLGVNLPAMGAGKSVRSTRLKLEDCLSRFTSNEKLANYVCEKCTQSSSTTKRLRIAQPPPVLLVQLKRFKHLGSKGGSSKVDVPVDFQLRLDLAPFVDASTPTGSLPYDLYGVISHTGTLDTGHYTCMMKHSSGQWFEFDDAQVTTVSVDSVLSTPSAYLLCYVMQNAL